MIPAENNDQLDLATGLDAPLYRLLVRIARIAHTHGMALWLVGGVVRDLLLGRTVDHDLDLVIEGNAPAFAHILADELGGQVKVAHAAFGTATVALPNPSDMHKAEPLLIDLATARIETYPHPAALPVVQPAPIVHDLGRRDFSINALAVAVQEVGMELAPAPLLDPFQGQHDLAIRQLRVLHDQSFDDDPTRMLRGVRLAARLNLRLESHTQTLLQAALARNRLEATTPERIRTELCLALSEPQPATVLQLADAWGITPHIFASLRWSAALAQRCDRVLLAISRQPSAMVPVEQVYAGVLTYDLTASERDELAERYRLPKETARVLHEIGVVRELYDTLLAPGLRPSEIDRRLQRFSPATLLVAACAEPPPMPDILHYYLAELRPVTPLLDGHALQQHGVAPGPHLGQLLRDLRAARLDGLVVTRADEEAWVDASLR